MAAEKTDYSKFILPAGGLLALGLVLQKFGLIPSQESAKQEKNVKALDSLEEFKPGYGSKMAEHNGWKKVIQTLLTTAGAHALAARIKKAKGIFNDDELAVYSAFKTVRNKAQVSQLAETFQREYGMDLVEFLRDFMNEKELARVFDLVEILPTGLKKY